LLIGLSAFGHLLALLGQCTAGREGAGDLVVQFNDQVTLDQVERIVL
jgi:hypothetical protein